MSNLSENERLTENDFFFFLFCFLRPGQNEKDHGNDDVDGGHEGDDDHPAGAWRAVPDGRQGDDHQQNSVGPVADHHPQETHVQVGRARCPRDALVVGRVAVVRRLCRLRRRRRRMGQEVVRAARRSNVSVQLS